VSYDAVAKTIHWLTALAIIVMFGLAWIMTNDVLPAGPLKYGLYQAHKSLGILILVLSVPASFGG